MSLLVSRNDYNSCFRRALHKIRTAAVQSVHNHNIGSPNVISAQDVVIQRLKLIWKLESWSNNGSSVCALLSTDDCKQFSILEGDTHPVRVLLSLHYHSVALMIDHAPLMRYLALNHDILPSCRVEINAAIEHDFITARAFCNLVQLLATSSSDFISRYSIWWLCNYTGKLYYLLVTFADSDFGSVYCGDPFVLHPFVILPRSKPRSAYQP